MTERIYYRDATLLTFDALVLAQAGDARRVILDRTAFYPTSGGQPHDTGVLGTARVLDVLDEGDEIVHVLDRELSRGPVHGEVDAARRRDHMQQHTAQHLLSAIAADQFGWETVSVHFGAEHSTIEFATATVTEAQLIALETLANAVVREARPVTVTFEDAAAAASAGLRKPADRTGELRVVTIAGVDRSACGGTHLSQTAEIGMVMLQGIERLRGRVRAGFLAGDRVLVHARGQDRLVGALVSTFSCSRDELPDLVARRIDEMKLSRKRIEELEHEVAVTRLHSLAAATPPDADGIRRIIHRGGAEPASALRAMAQAAVGLERTVFVASAESPPAVLVSTSADSGIDAGARLKSALAAFGGKGGGSPRIAQGTVPDSSRLEEVVMCCVA